jgi:TolB protein
MRKLLSPLAMGNGDGLPAFSPDGRRLAFCRWSTYADSDLYMVNLSPDFRPLAEPKRLTVGNWLAVWPAWTVDGNALVFSGAKSGNTTLWKLDFSTSSTPTRLVTLSRNCNKPAISHHGNRLTYVQQIRDSNIWRMEIGHQHGKALSPGKFIYTTRMERGPAFSPDGKRIAFLSDRSGSWEFWICNSDGLNPVQLTSLGGGVRGWGIAWSPDSTRLTFSWGQKGKHEVYVINASGGSPFRVTTTPGEYSWGSRNPSWSYDGKMIFFDVAEKKGSEVCKVPAGGGPVVKVAHIDGFEPFESQDGKFIYYIREAPGFFKCYRMPENGGKAEHVFDLLDYPVWPVNDGMYFIAKPERLNDYSIQFLDTATGNTRQIAAFDHAIIDFTVSPDHRWLLWAQNDQSDSDLMLVENFK